MSKTHEHLFYILLQDDVNPKVQRCIIRDGPNILFELIYKIIQLSVIHFNFTTKQKRLLKSFLNLRSLKERREFLLHRRRYRKIFPIIAQHYDGLSSYDSARSIGLSATFAVPTTTTTTTSRNE